MAGSEPGQSRHQPLDGERRQNADFQRAAFFLSAELDQGAVETFQKIPDDRRQGPARFGKNQAASSPIEELDLPDVLGVLDLVADGALGDEQFFGRAGVAEMSGRRFQGAQ